MHFWTSWVSFWGTRHTTLRTRLTVAPSSPEKERKSFLVSEHLQLFYNLHESESWAKLNSASYGYGQRSQLVTRIVLMHHEVRSWRRVLLRTICFRALRVPISSRMLSDILSRLVETIAEQGEDMQGYVTELILTLEAVIECLDADIR